MTNIQQSFYLTCTRTTKINKVRLVVEIGPYTQFNSPPGLLSLVQLIPTVLARIPLIVGELLTWQLPQHTDICVGLSVKCTHRPLWQLESIHKPRIRSLHCHQCLPANSRDYGPHWCQREQHTPIEWCIIPVKGPKTHIWSKRNLRRSPRQPPNATRPRGQSISSSRSNVALSEWTYISVHS